MIEAPGEEQNPVDRGIQQSTGVARLDHRVPTGTDWAGPDHVRTDALTIDNNNGKTGTGNGED